MAALTGALAASMAAMVANLTLGKEKFQEVAPDMDRVRREAEETLEAMGKLMEADMEAFNAYMEALRLPKNTPEEKSFRQQKMQEALRRATEVPLEIAGRCFKVLELALEAARKGNEMAVSDAGVAGHLAWAALQAALLNVDINLPYLKDEELAVQFRAQRENLMEKGREVWEQVVIAVQEKMIK